MPWGAAKFPGTHRDTGAFYLAQLLEECDMADPSFDDRPDLRPDRYRMDNNAGWIFAGVIGALLLAGFVFYSLSGEGPRTASTPAPETTGRVERAPAPQALPPKPTPAPAPQRQ
jgi:hypothetical protein